MLQHGAYTLLIDACYDRERFPTREEAIEWTWAQTPEEIAAVAFVLGRFFVLGDDGRYTQARIHEEILSYRNMSVTNKKIAVEREAVRRKNKGNSTKRARSVNEPPPNQEPLTTNQEPINNTHAPSALKHSRFDAHAYLCAAGVDGLVAVDWLALRKAKKAPVTETALRGIEREAGKAGLPLSEAIRTCCERGWSGFKADWVAGGNGVGGNSAKGVRHKQMVDEIFGRTGGENEGRIIDVTPGSDSFDLG